MPPTPVPNPVILVPGSMTPLPVTALPLDKVCPTASAPDATAVTVSVVPVIEPVTEAAELFDEPMSISATCAQEPSAESGATYRVA